MILYLDTTEYGLIILSLLKKQGKTEKEIFRKEFTATGKSQSEKLLPSIDKFLTLVKVSWNKIKVIRVKNQGGSFTGLRLGVITANTLAWSKNLKLEGTKDDYIIKAGIKLLKPIYEKEPDIVINKNKYGLD
ncbi:MAG: hypothetical protein K9M44_00625 [Candidatus Pacebacteria bacterium]|nr:hypothetical protein [Candidatus Paceibacterota bacterium]